MNEKQLQQEFIQFLAQKSGAKTLQELDKYIQSIGQKGMEKVKQEFIKLKQKEEEEKVKKNAHGAKLLYFRKLKNQCPEGEELVYYKRGGTVDCGCIKKGEAGMEAPEDKKESLVQTAIRKFKEYRNKKKKTLQQSTEGTGSWDKDGNYILDKEKLQKHQKQYDSNKQGDDSAEGPVNKGVGKNACGAKMKVKKDKYSSKVMQDKCGAKVKKKACGAKVEKEKCGNKVVAKFKNRKK